MMLREERYRTRHAFQLGRHKIKKNHREMCSTHLVVEEITVVEADEGLVAQLPHLLRVPKEGA